MSRQGLNAVPFVCCQLVLGQDCWRACSSERVAPAWKLGHAGGVPPFSRNHGLQEIRQRKQMQLPPERPFCGVLHVEAHRKGWVPG